MPWICLPEKLIKKGTSLHQILTLSFDYGLLQKYVQLNEVLSALQVAALLLHQACIDLFWSKTKNS